MTAPEYVPRGMPEKENIKIYTVIWSPTGNKVVIMCAPETCRVPRLRQEGLRSTQRIIWCFLAHGQLG